MYVQYILIYFSSAPLYLDALPRKRGASIFDPLATPGLPSSSAARLSTFQPPIFFPPRPVSRESAYETPESFSSPHSPACGSRESIKTRTAAVKNDTSSSHRAHSYPPPDDFCSEVSEKLRKESERQKRSDKFDEEETEVAIDSEPSSATVVENGLVINGDCRSDGLRIVGRTQSLVVSDVIGRIGNISESDSDSDLVMRRQDAMEYSSSQYSEFSPVPPEEGEGTAGVGRLEDSYIASKQSSSDRRSHSSSGSFGSSLNPRTDSHSQASNRSSADSSHLVNGERKKPQMRLKFHSSSQSIPDDKYFTPAANVAAGKHM